MLAILVTFSKPVGSVAIPTLSAVLMVAAVRALRIAELRTILLLPQRQWSTGRVPCPQNARRP
jgi:hypothetical protein